MRSFRCKVGDFTDPCYTISLPKMLSDLNKAVDLYCKQVAKNHRRRWFTMAMSHANCCKMVSHWIFAPGHGTCSGQPSQNYRNFYRITERRKTERLWPFPTVDFLPPPLRKIKGTPPKTLLSTDNVKQEERNVGSKIQLTGDEARKMQQNQKTHSVGAVQSYWR